MKSITKNQGTNEERTNEYINKWNTEKTLKTLINNKEPCVFDIGANNGCSINDFKNWWPKSVIHCFEPQHECYESIKKTASQYDEGSIYINMTAVGNRTSEKEAFYTHDINSGISGFNKINVNSNDSIKINDLNKIGEEKKNEYEKALNHSREVQIIRLDEYINTIDSNLQIDFLKIDTQGHEPEVLDGLGNKLSNVNVVLTELMFFDFYERSLSFSDIEKYLLKYDFSLFDISHISKNPMNGRTDWVDVIYVNNKFK